MAQPRPRTLTVTMSANNAESTTVQVVNATGATVISQNLQLMKGVNTFSVAVSPLPKGMYRIQLNTAKGLITQPFVKE